MRIVMLSDSFAGGGAAIAATRLGEALAARGHVVTRISIHSDPAESLLPTKGLSILPARSPIFRVGRKVCPSILRNTLRSGVTSRLVAALRDQAPDVISVHNLHAAHWAGASVEFVKLCCGVAPTVWTLHDMWSFTGRCVHALDCALFRSGCDDTCLTADEYPVLARALIQEAWLEKAALLGTNENLFGVSPSAWLRDKAESGLWNARKVSVIPNGIPLEGYRAANQSAARRALGIGDDECVVITGGSLTPASKGASILRTALQMLDDLKVTVLTMGGTGFGDQVPNARHLGYVSSEAQKILAYSAADLFIHPSVADNLPNVIMEAFACGTPVLAFRTGGMPEMIRDGVNGWCVWPPTPEVLANALRSVLSDMAKLKELRPGCLAVAANEYDVELQASRYEDLFNSIKPESTYAPELLTAQRGATAG